MVGVVVAGAGAVVVAVGVAVGVVVAVAVVVGVVVVFGVAVGVVVAVAGVKSRLIRRWIGRVRQRARFDGVVSAPGNVIRSMFGFSNDSRERPAKFWGR